MLIRIGYELTFQAPARTPMLLMLYTHPSRAASLRQPDHVHVEPYVPVREFIDALGNRCGRLVASPGKLRLWNTTLIEDSRRTRRGLPLRHPAAGRGAAAGNADVAAGKPVLRGR